MGENKFAKDENDLLHPPYINCLAERLFRSSSAILLSTNNKIRTV